MIKENFYVVYLAYSKTDGNDVFFVTHKKFKEGEKPPLSTDLEKAAIFSENELIGIYEDFAWVSNRGSPRKILFQDAHRISCRHVKASTLKKRKEIADGTPCFLLSKRDQCGSNASFWFYGNSGYTSDVRCAAICHYSKKGEEANRTFEYFVPVEEALKKSELRVDVQDIDDARERLAHHSVSYCNKIISKQTVEDVSQ